MRADRLVVALALLTTAQAWANPDSLEFRINPPVAVWVTGSGAAKTVGWPDGPAGLTPKWLVAESTVDWNCGNGKAVSLKLSLEKGPSAAPQRFDLTKTQMWGGATRLSLYLWSLDDVKKVCVRDGTVKLESMKVQAELGCPGGALKKTLTASLDVDCEVSKPPAGAAPGQAERVSSIASRDPGGQGPDLKVGAKQKIELYPLLPRTLLPPARTFTPVRLDAAGKVVERFAACRPTGTDDEQCRFAVEVTPKEAGTMRIALEAEYLDDTRVLSKVSEIRVATAEQLAAAKANALSYDERSQAMEAFNAFVGTLTDPEPAAVDKALKDFVAKNPAFQSAGYNGHNFWANFRDGRALMVEHSIPVKPKAPAIKSPPAWVALMTRGHDADGSSDYRAAQAAFGGAVAEAEKLGPDDPHLAAALTMYALSLRRQSEYAKTVPFYQRALAIEQKVLGANHPKVVHTLLDLALMQGQTDPSAEDAVLQQALKLCEDMKPPDIDLHKKVLSRLAMARHKAHKDDEARALGRKAEALVAPGGQGYGGYAAPYQPDVVTRLEQTGVPAGDDRTF